jgi:hypothetical protein
LKKYYTIDSIKDIKDKISIINNIQLLPEEKFRILNFKPKTEIELELVGDVILYLFSYIVS